MTSNTGSGAIDAVAARALVEPLTGLVAQAGKAILSVKRTSMRIEGKADGSPVTEADHAADLIVAEGLKRIAQGVPVLSEERTDPAARPYGAYGGSFFLVDPLDGTKEFIAGRSEFTVNIALITHGEPVLGVIAAPALGLIWRGIPGYGAEHLAISHNGELGPAERIQTRPHPGSGRPWVAAVSRSHGDARTEAFIAARPGAVRMPLGSAVKFGRIAEGTADIYPRLSPTSEWDIAAGHALVTAAGGKVTDGAGRAMRFGEAREDFLVPDFIAWGDPAATDMRG